MDSTLMGSTGKLLTIALDVSSLRQQALAHNIANVNTPGYVPYDVHFDGQLDQLRAKLRAGEKLNASDVPSLTPHLTPVTTENGMPAKIALDMEAAKLAENALHYQAVVKAYSQMSNLLGFAINEGKR